MTSERDSRSSIL